MSLPDWFIQGFGSAISDIRRKVVEEPWYGKSLGTEPRAPSLSEALGWARQQPGEPDVEPSHGLAPKPHEGQGHDR